ncbi:MAG: response regulator, partial [Thermodesulfobacteriota bacterium]|nr:response regulator [Thermodesulfobacteriota bacterium]
DADVDLLNGLEAGLQKYKGQFEVLTVLDGQEAISVLRREPISVLVTGLVLPKVDGLELLAHMTKHYPTTPCMVMTKQGSPPIPTPGEHTRSFQYMEKPVDFNELGGAIIGRLNGLDEGDLGAGLLVSDFLHLIKIEEKTCRLEVHGSKEGGGWFHFDRGVLEDAHCPGFRGEEAASMMIGWGHGHVRLRSLQKKGTKGRIHRALTSLMMAKG